MSLEEYEALLAAKKAALNKPATEVKVDLDAFKGMKTYVRKDAEEEVPGIELSNRKKAEEKAAAEKAAAEKPKKQVRRGHVGQRFWGAEAGAEDAGGVSGVWAIIKPGAG